MPPVLTNSDKSVATAEMTAHCCTSQIQK